ncbi:hypothetical protein [Pigmentiphaga sp. NML080357]|nr:hypothetical protein [Pigmentiphaga sp. NML080357]
MATFLVFIGVLAATVGFIYLLVRIPMLFNRGGEDDSQQDPPAKASGSRD